MPFLGQAVAYDRVTGYFSSSALAIAAEGISRFIAHGGKMRLVVGAQLSDEDVRAVLDGAALAEIIAKRLEQAPLEAADAIAQHRLATLAYLVREGRLEMKVGVPLDHLGRPLRQAEADRLLPHQVRRSSPMPTGDRVVFVGRTTSPPAAGCATTRRLRSRRRGWSRSGSSGGAASCQVRGALDGRADPEWAIFDLPDAVRAQLVERAPPEPPVARDPGEHRTEDEGRGDDDASALRRRAPRLGGGTGVGFATAGVDALPHQLAIARRAVDTYPRSYLLADEVGLGKTIEAGLILRELLVSGRAQRALVLVPASVIRQWQEELFEKFALDVPRFDGGSSSTPRAPRSVGGQAATRGAPSRSCSPARTSRAAVSDAARSSTPAPGT